MMFKALGRIWMRRKKLRRGGLWSPLFRDIAEKLSQDGALGMKEEMKVYCTLRK